MNGYYSKQPRFWRGLSLIIGLSGVLLWPSAVSAQDATRDFAQQGRSAKQRAEKPKNTELERRLDSQSESEPDTEFKDRPEQPLSWARIDFILNRVNLVPRRSSARRARISDVLGIGDALQTFESSNAEVRFNDGSEVRIGSLATFRFTPNTRNFELTNGTVLLLIPPERGRTTIQTPNAVTGIQGSALFVRYIEETDTTIVGALTDNPDGPMILFTNNGTEQQALYANQVGVVRGDRITELYEIDSRAFWESSGLAETFDYTEDAGVADELDGVRKEIREAIENQEPIDGSNVVENPESFSRPESATPTEVAEPTDGDLTEDPSEPTDAGNAEGSENEVDGTDAVEAPDLTLEPAGTEESEDSTIQYEGSPAEEFHNQNGKPAAPGNETTNSLKPAALTEAEGEDEETEEVAAENGNRPNANAAPSGTSANANPSGAANPATSGGGRQESDRPASRPSVTTNSPATNNPPVTTNPPATNSSATGGSLIDNPVPPIIPGKDPVEIVVPPTVGTGQSSSPTTTAQPNVPTGGVIPRPSSALQDADPVQNPGTGNATGGSGAGSAEPPENPSEATPNDSVPAEPVVPPITDSEDESGEAAPIIEETDATLNNPDAAEAVEIPEVSEPVENDLVAPSEGTDSEAVIPPSGIAAPDGLEEVVEADALEMPTAEVVTPVSPSEGIEDELIVPDGPEVFEDESVEVEAIAVPETVEIQVQPAPLTENVPLVESVPLETIEEPAPMQLEETVPFVVEQVDELPAGQALRGNEQMGNGQMNNAGGAREDATLSNTPSDGN